MRQPWAPTTVDEQVQVEEATALVQAEAAAPAESLEHFADYIPKNRWDRATWIHQPDPLVFTVLMDTALGTTMSSIGALALFGFVGPLTLVVWLVVSLVSLGAAVRRSWRYSRRTWPEMYRLAHTHALPSVANGKINKRWVPGHERQRYYLNGRLP